MPKNGTSALPAGPTSSPPRLGKGYTGSGWTATEDARIASFEWMDVAAMRFQTIVDPNYRPCMECDSPGNPKTVLLGRGVGVEVRVAGTDEVFGYLHANCKDTWISKNDGAKFSFRLV